MGSLPNSLISFCFPCLFAACLFLLSGKRYVPRCEGAAAAKTRATIRYDDDQCQG